MANNKNHPNAALLNSLSASGEDLPLLQPEPPSESESAQTLEQVSLEPSPFAVDSPVAADFSESEALFSELQNFGETGVSSPTPDADPSALLNFDTPEPIAAPSLSTPSLSTSPSAKTKSPVMGSAKDFPVTPADSLPGLRVERYLGLVSAWVRLDTEEADPLAQACATLAKNTLSRGGNAVLSVRLQATGEGQGLLLVGTAVVSSRE